VQDGAPGELLQLEGFFQQLFGDEILAA
jgi:hypothetical protein